jgi:hypothetical protein
MFAQQDESRNFARTSLTSDLSSPFFCGGLGVLLSATTDTNAGRSDFFD